MANKDLEAVTSGLNDLLSNVIRTDRERAGRGKTDPSPAVPVEAPPVSAISSPSIERASPAIPADSDTKTLRQYDTMTNGTESDARPTSPRPTPPVKRKVKTPEVVPSSSAANRVEIAQAMAESSTMTVTLRIPQEFNAWLDEYVHGSWPQRVRKQELVTEALKMLYARRGHAKEEILSTPLLGEEAE